MVELIISGVKNIERALKTVEQQVKKGIVIGAAETVEIGKREAKKTLKPYNYSQVLYNSIYSNIEVSALNSFVAYLIASAPYAGAIEFGNPSYSSSIVSLPRETVLVYDGGYVEKDAWIWKGSDAEAWKKEHYPRGKGGTVLITGKSGSRDTPDSTPFPKGVHFMRAGYLLMEKNFINVMIKNIVKSVKTLGKR